MPTVILGPAVRNKPTRTGLALGLLVLTFAIVGSSAEPTSRPSGDSRAQTAHVEPSPQMVSAGKLLTEKAPLRTYQSGPYGITIRYPYRYEVTAGEPPIFVLFSGLQEPPGRVPVVTIAMPYGAYPDSDLGGAFINIGVNDHLSKGECESLPYKSGNPDGPPTSSAVISINGIRFTGTESGGVAGGTAYDETDYVTFRNGVCYEIAVEIAVSTALLGQHVDGTVLPVDHKDVDRRLRAILSTLRIRRASSNR